MKKWIVTEEELQAAEAEAIASGKEKFDWATFAQLYTHQHGDCEDLPLDESQVDSFKYKARYYSEDNIRTVADFARFMDEEDAKGEF